MIYLSHVLNENTPTYGKRDKLEINELSSINKGDSANSSRWSFSTNHMGTHIDAPSHFCKDGFTITDYEPDFWICRNVYLIDVSCSSGILIKDQVIKAVIPESTELLLIRTGYEKYRTEDKYWNDSPGLSPDLADVFRNTLPNLKMVGFDFLSLTSWNFRAEGREAHKNFLCGYKPILVIEDMKLSVVSQIISEAVVLPVRVEDTNGAPVTVIAGY